jgi:hypothetical protein
MEEMWEIQKTPAKVAPDSDDVWALSRQGSPEPPESEPTFFYSRERRLEHSSKAVRELHDPDADRKRGRGFHLFSRLSRHPSKVMMFGSMMAIFMIIGLINVFTGVLATEFLGGNAITASARRSNGTTVITINKTFKEENVGDVYSGAIDVAVGPSPPPRASIRRKNPFAEEDVVIDADHPLVAERIEFSLEPKEVYELILPYEAPNFRLLMKIGDDELITMRITAKRTLKLFGREF